MLIKNVKSINQNLNLSQIIKSENGTHCKYQVQKIAQEIPNEFPLHVSYNFYILVFCPLSYIGITFDGWDK